MLFIMKQAFPFYRAEGVMKIEKKNTDQACQIVQLANIALAINEKGKFHLLNVTGSWIANLFLLLV